MRPARALAVAAALAATLAGCAVIDPPPQHGAGDGASHTAEASHTTPGHTSTPTDTRPVRALRAGERFLTVGVADVGSSRVDLQACKLEYSIVSPK